MAVDSAFIDVRISQRVLWVGGAAYPLGNIGKVQAVKLPSPSKGPAADYRRAVLPWGIGFVAGLVLRFGSSPIHVLGQLLIVVSAAVVLVRTILLIASLRAPGDYYTDYYALAIVTGGAAHHALVSPKKELVNSLVHQIMDAVDNPQAEFHASVQNFHFGDTVQQFGNRNIGKVFDGR